MCGMYTHATYLLHSLSSETLSGGHFGAVHKATLLSHSGGPTLRTVSVRVVGSHCPEREAVQMLQQACIMAQLSHTNVATVLGMTLSQQPVSWLVSSLCLKKVQLLKTPM